MLEIKDNHKFEWEYRVILNDLKQKCGKDADIVCSCMLSGDAIIVDGVYYGKVSDLLQPEAVQWKAKEYFN